jgi:hypothetical protein
LQYKLESEAAEAFRKWRGTFVYDQNQTILCREPNEKFLKYGVSITSEMAFTESSLLQKGHFLSIAKEGVHSRNTFLVL